MKRILTCLSALFAMSLTAIAEEEESLSCSFTAQEAQVVYYTMGWDSTEEASQWSYSGQCKGNNTWHLRERPPQSSQPAFSSIDPGSKYSLCILYGDEQNEVATSPAIAIQPHSSVEFYACFQAIFLVFADLKLYVTDSDNESKLMWSAFQWSQENAYTGPSWQKYTFDLSEFAGKNVSFRFEYVGSYGEDMAIDGFRILQNIDDGEAIISINEGGKVHFLDTSTGHPVQWQWTFEGGLPATSSEQNPVVTYPKAGSYNVTLSCSTANGSDVATTTREGFVNVVSQAPTALIGLPQEGYLSPWTALFIPTETTVQYHDLSSGLPTSWLWTFEGGNPEKSTEQNPIVTYSDEGVYGMMLEASNAAGSSTDFMKDAIQVGGSQYIWNIDLEEYDLMGEASLGWLGYYGGTNWLNIEKFAEHYQAPLAPATVDAVQVYFYHTTTISPEAEIKLQLCAEDADGYPGEVLAETAVKAGELVYDDEVIMATDFVFDQPVEIDKPFFIVIGPFPNNDNGNGDYDAISMLLVRREEGQKCTAWHLAQDEDPRTYEPLGTYTWYQNVDDPFSFAITPRLSYTKAESTGIMSHQPTSTPQQPSAIYDLQGRLISHKASSFIHQPSAIFIVRDADGRVRKIRP